MDVDVEAMLEAPFQENNKPGNESTNDHRKDDRDSRHRHSSRSSRSSTSPSRHRHRSSSRSHRSSERHSSRRYRSSRERRDRSRSPRRDERRRRRSRSSRRTSGSRDRSSNRRSRAESPPVPEEIRDRRTVFVSQLAQRLTTRELEEFLGRAGRVRDARIVTDKKSGRSKGVGYVEFYEEESVANALEMAGQTLLGIPVKIELTEAEKNRLAMMQQNARLLDMVPKMQNQRRLRVSNFHTGFTEDDIRDLFQPFGSINFVDLHRDKETGQSLGYAFIEYKVQLDAKNALEKMNDVNIADMKLKVEPVTEEMSGQINCTNLDDDDTGALTLNNSYARANLMNKLMRSDERAGSGDQVDEDQNPKMNLPEKPSRTIMLDNMFNPNEETEPDWVSELASDIKSECEKYGEVEHIHINPDSMGEVYLKFTNISHAENAKKDLAGRWFGGKQIKASFMPEAIYNAHFSL